MYYKFLYIPRDINPVKFSIPNNIEINGVICYNFYSGLLNNYRNIDYIISPGPIPNVKFKHHCSLDSDLENRLQKYIHMCILQIDYDNNKNIIKSGSSIELLRILNEFIEEKEEIKDEKMKIEDVQTENLKIVKELDDKNRIVIVKNFKSTIINKEYYNMVGQIEIDEIKNKYLKFIKSLKNLDELADYSNFIIALK